MKMWKTLVAFVLCLALALPCALAEDAYMPGETMRALFADAWNRGQMITADLSLQVALNGDVLGLSQEEMAQVEALTTMLDTTTLRVGACAIDGGVRLLLAGLVKAQEGAEDVYADVAVDVTRAGMSIDSSLLEGRRVSVTWETLLSLAGLSDEETAMVLGMLDADWETLLTELIEQAQPYAEIAIQVLSPYGETVAAWAQTLTIEQMTDVEATEDYPAVATLVDVYVTEKDLGVLIKALADQLAQDEELCSLLDELIPELIDDDSYPGTAALCAQLSESAASLTDEEYPLILTLGLDENDTPLYVEFYNAQSDSSGQYAGLFLYPDAADPEAYYYEFSCFGFDAMGNATDGLMIYGTYKQPDTLTTAITLDGAVIADREYLCAISYVVNTEGKATAEGLPGVAGTGELSMSFGEDDESQMVFVSVQSNTGLTPQGGEQNDMLETVEVYEGDFATSMTLMGTMIVEPGENGLTGSFSVLESIPDVGLDRYGMQIILSSEDYVPAALTELAYETIAGADMEALMNELSSNAMALAEKVLQAYPQDVVETLNELAEDM